MRSLLACNLFSRGVRYLPSLARTTTSTVGNSFFFFLALALSPLDMRIRLGVCQGSTMFLLNIRSMMNVDLSCIIPLYKI